MSARRLRPFIREVLDYSINAVAAADAAGPVVTINRDEFERLRNDVHCIRAMSENYAAKVNAADAWCCATITATTSVTWNRRKNSWSESFADYQQLAALTEKTYHFANSMQTSQRKIPFTGGVNGVGTNYLWSQLVPLYRKELDDFRARVVELQKTGGHPAGGG